MYIFNKEIRLQISGGAIGVDLTGVMAQIFMSWWDKELLKTLNELRMEVMLYERYVDDIDICINALPPGTRFINSNLEICDDEVDEDKNTPKDKRTMDLIKQIGDSIHMSIVLGGDVPSNHTDGKVPILDLKVWIEDIETPNGKKRYIMHEHCSKQVSSKLLIHRDAALSMSTKRTVLTQQCLRVMLNCSPKLDRKTVERHLNYFMLRMQVSKYDKSFRYEVIKSAYNAYDKIKEKGTSDGIPMYRNKTYKSNERREDKIVKTKNWYKKGGYESVIFVAATPESKLQKEMQAFINETDTKIKVIEKSGNKLVRMLQKNDPFKINECGKHNCLLCNSSKNGNCRSTGVVYDVKCEGECPFRYRGQTAHNAYTRGLKHIEDLTNKRDKTLWKHCLNEHNGEIKSFEMKILERCRNDATKRQVIESIWIRRTDPKTTMNERSEWGEIKLPRI